MNKSKKKNLESNLKHHKKKFSDVNSSIFTCTNFGIKEYESLMFSELITEIKINYPLKFNTKSNKRVGFFLETKINFLNNFKDAKNFWLYPVKIGKYTCHIYCHKDYKNHVLAVSNMFEIIEVNELNKKPNLICLFGVKEEKVHNEYFLDRANDLIIGKISHSKTTDYFGYMKKMCLTLHNIKAIEENRLPIHGAFFKVYLYNGNMRTIMIIGDSGTGKSEIIESITKIENSKVSKIEIIFDDMGVIDYKNNKVSASGTEIGAFIRLDDIDTNQILDSTRDVILINSNKKNARLIKKINSYANIIEENEINFIFYANNYSKEKGIKKILSFDEITETFILGKRISLGTTDEKGICKTFFSNPFGPHQKQKETKIIFDKVFKKLYNTETYIGEIYTGLGISNDTLQIDYAANKLIELISLDCED